MPTFTYLPDRNSSRNLESNVSKIKFGDNYEQRQAVGLNPTKQVWNLNFSNRTETEAADIDSFLLARKGTESFDWTPPGSLTSIKVKCDLNSISKTPSGYNGWSLSAKFEQVYEP